MADGQIKIAIEVDGKQVDVASKSLDNLEASGSDAGKGVKQAEDGLKGVNQESSKASSNVKKFATALGLVAIGAAAFQVLRASMDDAISRFDTLNNFPKVLQALGVSAEDSERAMERLSDGIDGLPTKLDEISSTAQRMYTSFNDMDKATDTALALNNALLGSGSSAEGAQRGTEQYLQALQRGKFEMEEWKTLQETMDIGLIKVAESFGYAGKTAKQDLYNALKDGTITMDEFNDKLIEVGTGTGIMAKLAKENSLGIATSLGNLRNAAARGIANILDSFNKLSKEVTGKDIAQNIDGLKAVVNSSFRAISSAIEKSTPIVILFADGVKIAIPVVQALTPAIIGLMAAYAAYAVISKASAAISSSNAVLKVAIASTQGLTLATKAQTTATVAQTGAVKLSTLAIGVMTGRIGLATAAKTIATAASYAFGSALRFLTGPVGLVTAGIGVLTAGAIAVVKWFKRSTDEAKKLNKETKDLGDATDSLNDEIKNTSEAFKNSQKDIEATAKANDELAKKVDELARKENKSATEKAMLAGYVDRLNESVEGLNLAYDEESDKLSMSSEQLKARVDLMKEQTSYNEALERQVEISKEQSEVDQQLEETNRLRDEWNQKLDEGTVKSGEHKKAIEELNEQETTLEETQQRLRVEYEQTETQLTTSMEAITEATQNGVANQKLAYEDLSEAQQQTVDNMKTTWEEYKEAATNMFDTLSEEAELTVDEMTANLEKNQEIIGNWAEGIATLAERGVDEGLLDTLREAGPESAGHVNALVNASDEELAKLSEVFAKGGETATDALSKSLGIEETNLLDSVSELVVDTEQSLREQIKNADFEGIGVNLGEGLADGINSSAPKAENASKEMADDTIHAAKDVLGVRSPSTVFKGFGRNITEGLVLGVNGGTSLVINAMKKLSNTTVNQFKGTPSDFNSIGRDAMTGLNRGLLAGRGQVLSTARSIANSVASTMKNALKIQSPSRLMRDDIGKMIPAGIALGIKDNMNLVENEMSRLSTRMIMSTPEQALGTSRMAYSSGGSQFVGRFGGSNTTLTRRQNSNQVIKIEASDVIIDGYKVGKVIWKPVKDNIDRDDEEKGLFRG